MIPYKRFIVLADDQYYPGPGISGSGIGSFETLEEAVAMAESRKGSYDYFEVFDCEQRIIAWSNE